MQVFEIDNVKIYNLSAGKSLPDVSTLLLLLQFSRAILVQLLQSFILFVNHYF